MPLFISDDVEYDTHLIKKGDTLTSISKLYDVPIGKIASLNDILSSSDLIVGTTIKIKEKDVTYPLVYKTKTNTDDDIELMAFEAGKQVTTIDDIQQQRINEMKNQYHVTGDIRTMYNDVLYLNTNKKYSLREENKEFNDLSINTSDDSTSIYSVKNTSSTSKPLNRVTMSSSVQNTLNSKKASTQKITVNILNKK